MLAQVTAIVSALAASAAARPSPEATARRTTPVTLPALSWGACFAHKNCWNVLGDTNYIEGLPGFAVSCSGSFNDNNELVGAWNLCSGFPRNATVEGQLLGPGGDFLASVRHNVTQNGKTTVVIASGPGAPFGEGQFEFTVQSVETVV
ncbi:hypothetical protein GGR51DRAFT_564334 [Nemania sp. FL0031]|nr:hypothetical protein GGR51DRAFT_564334 [Nemania sp. FL0031]